jgi:thioesterase domain-containing protein
VTETYTVSRRGTDIIVTQSRPDPVDRRQTESFTIPIEQMRTLMPELAQQLRDAEDEAAQKAERRLEALKARRADALREIDAIDAEMTSLDALLATRLIEAE